MHTSFTASLEEIGSKDDLFSTYIDVKKLSGGGGASNGSIHIENSDPLLHLLRRLKICDVEQQGSKKKKNRRGDGTNEGGRRRRRGRERGGGGGNGSGGGQREGTRLGFHHLALVLHGAD
ncbi:hypothetical protein PIB30_064829 [Stylosanthes scabra]|uniref:Uncharacterized protein n=1 Tax=Stylosanthes scabra TaxID=79078 RepID=A0ABU6ZKI3_9FABA|nr:hypothetical protein [Stylosanthes scabra]